MHVMVDIETLGSADNSVILSIGACAFDHETTEHIFHESIDINSCLREGMIVSGDTIKWWIQQDKEAVKHAFGQACSITDACLAFNFWCTKQWRSTKSEIWANPPQFDIVILKSIFQKLNIKFPFHHKQERDMRTIVALYKSIIPGAKSKIEVDHPNRLAHHAGDDAVYQAKVIQKIMLEMREYAMLRSE